MGLMDRGLNAIAGGMNWMRSNRAIGQIRAFAAATASRPSVAGARQLAMDVARGYKTGYKGIGMYMPGIAGAGIGAAAYAAKSQYDGRGGVGRSALKGAAVGFLGGMTYGFGRSVWQHPNRAAAFGAVRRDVRASMSRFTSDMRGRMNSIRTPANGITDTGDSIAAGLS